MSLAALYRDWHASGNDINGVGAEWSFLYGGRSPQWFWAINLSFLDGPFHRHFENQRYDLRGLGASVLAGVPLSQTRFSYGPLLTLSHRSLTAQSYEKELIYAQEKKDLVDSYSNTIMAWEIEWGLYAAHLAHARPDTGAPEDLVTRNDGWMFSVAYVMPVAVFYRTHEKRTIQGESQIQQDRSQYHGWSLKAQLTLFLGI